MHASSLKKTNKCVNQHEQRTRHGTAWYWVLTKHCNTDRQSGWQLSSEVNKAWLISVVISSPEIETKDQNAICRLQLRRRRMLDPIRRRI